MVIAVILAGGSGTRLWPLSREAAPKQIISLIGEKTLLQKTCERIGKIIPYEKQWIIAGENYKSQIELQLKELLSSNRGVSTINTKAPEVLIEPANRNTAPAVFWAAFRCYKTYGKDSLMVVLPSDHFISEESEFNNAIKFGISEAKKKRLITFGITPTHPETMYGYIKFDKQLKDSSKAFPVRSFVEKPNLQNAERYMEEGDYLWNSGMFVFHVGTLLEEGKRVCPDLYETFSRCNLFNTEEIQTIYNSLKPQSIDYAIMEKTKKAYVIPCSFGWNDVGNWRSVYEVSPKSVKNNVINGKANLIDTSNSLIYGKERMIAVIGMENIGIIDTPDALLVFPLEQAYRVKELVETLNKQNYKDYL
ncbi:MAG: Mannose-phosphate guanylyltransferase [Clostridia bacterium]|jgi:mannose-1-phosphate guanylyltransferase/mannose-6-phosphate isomerase|nr:Mannose-phosphate guanylyltransferase [Clostridia bacterium]